MKKSKYKEIIENSRDYSAKQFDKLIVYLSSGAIVFSTGFVQDIVEIQPKTDKFLLIFAWTSFVASLLFILMSHKSSLICMNKELEGKSKLSDKWDKITEILNWLSFIALITGIVSFIIFTSQNI